MSIRADDSRIYRMQKTNQITMKRPMKTITKLVLTGLATAIFATGSALADGGEWATLQSGNATVTYRRPAPYQATVAVSAHGKVIGSANGKAKESKLRVYRLQTGNRYVSYLAPAE